ncbi:hypothetical protein [Shimia abyssi]|uniref:Lipoprotein n=1 Tax=Shimia abyssi TaxID=1662395 RepID=A0A2P8FJH7_9RHOB|nr:hypothetical protein [Shimia abyssi]PSL21853.1 hypothetical protein CLV88_101277 [Shimia abyssi]
MLTRLTISLIATTALVGLSACEQSQAEAVSRDEQAFDPVYDSVDTRLLEGDLVNFHVVMSGARDGQDVYQYAECAAAQYALIRGFGFARHVRTTIDSEGSVWKGDSVYTISSALPRGLKTIDAEVTVSNCEDNGIPTV